MIFSPAVSHFRTLEQYSPLTDCAYRREAGWTAWNHAVGGKVWQRKTQIESGDKEAPVLKLASPSQQRHAEAMAKQDAFLILRQQEFQRQSAVSVLFQYDGQSLAGSAQSSGVPVIQVNGAAGAQEKSLKTVFEDMDVMDKLNIPGSASDLELKWTDPDDKEDIVWSLNQSADVNMSFFKDVQRVKIRVVRKV